MLLINGKEVLDDTTLIDPVITGKHVIKNVDEPGLGDRLTFGLDETARTMIVCDKSVIDNDLGISVQSSPALMIMDNIGTAPLILNKNTIRGSNGLSIFSGNTSPLAFLQIVDKPSSNVFTFRPDIAAVELTDTDGEQSMVVIESSINQSATAAYNGLKIDVTETALGDGSTGDGNNLLNLQVGSVCKARIDNTGRLVLAESTAPSALADHAFLYAKDVAGTGELFAADAAANETQLSSHAAFWPKEMEVSDTYPQIRTDENHALGIKRYIAMGKLAELVEQLSHSAGILSTDKKIVVFENTGITQDLEALQIEQFRKKYIKDNTQNIEVPIADAFEFAEEDEKVLYDVFIDGKPKKQGKKIDEKITGYELDGNDVKPKIEIIWETKKILKPKLKEYIKFNEFDGKFYKDVKPKKSDIDAAIKNDFVFNAPQWIKNKL